MKARHFVLALHDYFVERHHQKILLGTIGADSIAPEYAIGLEDDLWALSHINILHVQPILEAFDDDGTGFVSIKEANQFSTSRPTGWSLPQWIAYWAVGKVFCPPIQILPDSLVGWHQAICVYRDRICGILDTMYRRLDEVLPENRARLNEYLDAWSIRNVELIVRSTDTHCVDDPKISQNVGSHTIDEEVRMDKVLQSVQYEIDAPDTLALITGPGRIERNLFPLLFLVMRRHSRIISIARKEVIKKEELETAYNTLNQIIQAAQDRINNLTVIFRQTSKSVEDQFGVFAHGMFKYLFNDYDVYGCQLFADTAEGCYDDKEFEDAQDGLDTSLLKYGIGELDSRGNAFKISELGASIPDLYEVGSIPDHLIGVWVGHSFSVSGTNGLIRTVFRNGEDEESFEGEGEDDQGR